MPPDISQSVKPARLCRHARARECVCSDCPSHTPPHTLITQRNNRIGPTGAEKLTGALEKMTGLRELWLVSGRERGGGVIAGRETQMRSGEGGSRAV